MYLDVTVEAGKTPTPEALQTLSQTPKPTAFVDPEAKKLMAPPGGSQ